MTLLPGLIDCHDHIAGSVYGLVGRWELDAPPSLRHLRTAEVLRKTLDTGYTAMRDAGGLDKGFQTAIEEGLIAGPRMVLSLSIMSPTGGIGDWASPSGHRRPEPGNVSLPPGVANGVDAVRAKVRELDRMGADVIKFATTGGASSRPGHGPKDIAFGRDEIFAIVEEAHALGKRAMCHAIGGPGLRLAVEAGADSIEHGSYLDEDPELLPMMAEKGTFFVPTLTVYAFHREAAGGALQRSGEGDVHAPDGEYPEGLGTGCQGSGGNGCRGIRTLHKCTGVAVAGGARRNDEWTGDSIGDGMGVRVPRAGKGDRDCGGREAGGPGGRGWGPVARHKGATRAVSGEDGDQGRRDAPFEVGGEGRCLEGGVGRG